ncbi:hypothetical protein C8J56DRAFT_1090631 [Mycena floridula]|nr:hypothetical protein C8J56DRAFT_1090631 [Mycena floridula]
MFLQTILVYFGFRQPETPAPRVPIIHNSQFLLDDVIVDICDRLNTGDVFQLAMTCRGMFELLIPTIYSSVIFRCNNHCEQGLEFLLKHRYIASYIRNLRIRCNNMTSSGWKRQCDASVLNESHIIAKLEKLAPDLLNLNTFVWEGARMPQRDNFWSVLRNSCPNLRNLGTTVRRNQGRNAKPEILANSQVFEFRQLVGFAMVINYSGKGMESDISGAPSRTYPLPEMFWEFLRQNADLEELKIETYHANHFDKSAVEIDPLFQLHFPKLQTLSLGTFQQQITWNHWSDLEPHNESQAQFHKFLSNHRSLERVHWDSMYYPGTLWPVLPNLKHVRHYGPPFRMISVKNHRTLRTLEVLAPWRDTYKTSRLPNLTELTITLQRLPYQAVSSLRECHPNLRYLNISSNDYDDRGISLETLAAILLPKHLTTLRITTRVEGDESLEMEGCALSIFRHANSLQSLTIRCIYSQWLAGTLVRKGYVKVGRFEPVSRYPDTIIVGHEVFISAEGKREALRYRSTVQLE